MSPKNASPRESGPDSSVRRSKLTTAGSGSRASSPRRKSAARSTKACSASGQLSSSATSAVLVVARIRPRLPRENGEAEGVAVLPDGQTLELQSESGDSKCFAADAVFDARGASGNQQAVYDNFGRDLLQQALKGINLCIFAYGHTGSGKTFTMLGDGSAFVPNVQGDGAGLLPRMIHELFEALDAASGYRFTCEYYEVYNEQVQDLLAPSSGGNRKRTVHVHPKHGVRVEGLLASVVASAEETIGLLTFGNQMRTVSSTSLNDRSSRSHAIFTLRFQLPDTAVLPAGKGRAACLTFVDLAGREDQTASMNKAGTFREMCHINTSLFHLAQVITKLAEGQLAKGSLAEFRNSKLTLVLSQALVGNSRTALVATLAPSKKFFEDTLSTLNFAQSVKRIKTTAMLNNRTAGSALAELQAEIDRLRDELSKAKGGEKEQELQAAKALVAHFQEDWEDVKQRSASIQQNRYRKSVALGLTNPFFPHDAAKSARRSSLGTTSAGPPPNMFLTKLCDDATLQGCCNFELCKASMAVGTSDKCDLQLQGVGMLLRMCRLCPNAERGEVDVELLTSELQDDSDCSDDSEDAVDNDVPRVLVDGHALSISSPKRTLKHGGSLFVGFAHVFRLVVPPRPAPGTTVVTEMQTLARETLESLDLASALLIVEDKGVSDHIHRVLPYVQTLRQRAPARVVQNLLDTLRTACPAVDEADQLTKDIFASSDCFSPLHFELRALTNIFSYEDDTPEIVICVTGTSMESSRHGKARSSLLPKRHSLQSPAVAQSSTVNRVGSLICMWSFEEFLVRLGSMRELYEQHAQFGDGFAALHQLLRETPDLNPWQVTNRWKSPPKSSSAGPGMPEIEAAARELTPSALGPKKVSTGQGCFWSQQLAMARRSVRASSAGDALASGFDEGRMEFTVCSSHNDPRSMPGSLSRAQSGVCCSLSGAEPMSGLSSGPSRTASSAVLRPSDSCEFHSNSCVHNNIMSTSELNLSSLSLNRKASGTVSAISRGYPAAVTESRSTSPLPRAGGACSVPTLALPPRAQSPTNLTCTGSLPGTAPTVFVPPGHALVAVPLVTLTQVSPRALSPAPSSAQRLAHTPQAPSPAPSSARLSARTRSVVAASPRALCQSARVASLGAIGNISHRARLQRAPLPEKRLGSLPTVPLGPLPTLLGGWGVDGVKMFSQDEELLSANNLKGRNL